MRSLQSFDDGESYSCICRGKICTPPGTQISPCNIGCCTHSVEVEVVRSVNNRFAVILHRRAAKYNYRQVVDNVTQQRQPVPRVVITQSGTNQRAVEVSTTCCSPSGMLSARACGDVREKRGHELKKQNKIKIKRKKEGHREICRI